MNAQFIPEPEPLHEVAEKPGKRLRIARQARGLDQDSVAAHLHLSRAMVQALEQDNYDILPGAVFIRGYLRNYARLLGLDAEPLLNTFAATQPPDADPAPGVPHGARNAARKGRSGARPLMALVALGLAALLGFWWYNNNAEWPPMLLREQAPASSAAAGGDPTESFTTAAVEQNASLPEEPILEENAVAPEASSPPPAVADAPSPSLASPSIVAQATPPDPDTAGTEADLGEAITAAPGAETISVAPAPTAPDAAAPETSSAEDEDAAAETAAKEGVVFEFSGPCWVDIRDSTRKFKLFGEMQKGDRHVLGGIPPYSVILGNSPMVKISVKGADLDLAALSRGNVARFTLDPNSLD